MNQYHYPYKNLQQKQMSNYAIMQVRNIKIKFCILIIDYNLLNNYLLMS